MNISTWPCFRAKPLHKSLLFNGWGQDFSNIHLFVVHNRPSHYQHPWQCPEMGNRIKTLLPGHSQSATIPQAFSLRNSPFFSMNPHRGITIRYPSILAGILSPVQGDFAFLEFPPPLWLKGYEYNTKCGSWKK